MPLTRHSWRGMLNFPSCRHAFIGLVEGLRSLKTRRPEVTEDSNAKLESFIYTVTNTCSTGLCLRSERLPSRSLLNQLTKPKLNCFFIACENIRFSSLLVIYIPGADPGFFLGGGAFVSCSTSTPINHIVFFFCRITVVLENRRSSQEGGGAHPLHPPPRSAPVYCK